MDEAIDLLSAQERERIILALAQGRQGKEERSFTVDEAAQALSWANRVRMEHAMLDLVLKGLVSVDVGPGERVIWAPIAKEKHSGHL